MMNYRDERKMALSLDAIFYTSKFPCKNCHGAVRYCKTGICTTCQRARVRANEQSHRQEKTGGPFSYRVVTRVHPLDAPTLRAFVEGLNQSRLEALKAAKHPKRGRQPPGASR